MEHDPGECLCNHCGVELSCKNIMVLKYHMLKTCKGISAERRAIPATQSKSERAAETSHCYDYGPIDDVAEDVRNSSQNHIV